MKIKTINMKEYMKKYREKREYKDYMKQYSKTKKYKEYHRKYTKSKRFRDYMNNYGKLYNKAVRLLINNHEQEFRNIFKEVKEIK